MCFNITTEANNLKRDETMSKFKVGDNIIKVVGRIGAPKGFKSIVEPCGMYKDEHERVRPIF